MRVDKTPLKAAMKTKIKYPSSHDKVWTKINEELELILPSIFPDKIIKSSNPSDLSQKFDSWLHQFFLEKFGKAEKAKVSERKRSPRINKQLENLRRRKKERKKHNKLC